MQLSDHAGPHCSSPLDKRDAVVDAAREVDRIFEIRSSDEGGYVATKITAKADCAKNLHMALADLDETPEQRVVRCADAWEVWATATPASASPGTESANLADAVRDLRASKQECG
jgi:hypothetical protein